MVVHVERPLLAGRFVELNVPLVGVSRRPAIAHGRPATLAGKALPEVNGGSCQRGQFSNERNEDLQFARAR